MELEKIVYDKPEGCSPVEDTDDNHVCNYPLDHVCSHRVFYDMNFYCKMNVDILSNCYRSAKMDLGKIVHDKPEGCNPVEDTDDNNMCDYPLNYACSHRLFYDMNFYCKINGIVSLSTMGKNKVFNVGDINMEDRNE